MSKEIEELLVKIDLKAKEFEKSMKESDKKLDELLKKHNAKKSTK